MNAEARAAVVALLDGAMAQAARQRRADDATAEVDVVDLHVAFVRPAAGHLSASAQVCGGGRSICFCEAEASDAEGRLVARAMGTLRYRRT